MKDPEIRIYLKDELTKGLKHIPDSFLLEEFGLCQHTVRIDLAVLNGHLHGYEIKSEADDLSRLSLQEQIYSKIFDQVTIVLGQKHLKLVIGKIPHWWGIWEAISYDGTVKFRTIREAGINPAIDPTSLVQLLWRDEAIDILRNLSVESGFISKPRRAIWDKLVEILPPHSLRSLVHQHLKNRLGMPENYRPWSNGDSYPQLAT